ncbi:MAG: hypothetical protein IKZ14_01865 [Muribaculaceae bacterium]|nr:hypothetical protein [Muribaculaceae bacterium]
MNFKTDLPQIAALRNRVEETVGFQMKTHNDFVMLVDFIERQLKEHMSETTLERVWGYSTRGYDTVSMRTLSVLARLVNANDWDSFCQMLRNEDQKESEIFTANSILSTNLTVGTRLRIGWQPDRLITVKYLGDNRFEAETTENSSIKPGDSFSCMQFQKGRELYMDMFQRANETSTPDPNARYVVGQRNGLTTLEVLA